MKYNTTEVNVKICKNLALDASASLLHKVLEARGALEAMIKMGVYPPGEYVISRKGLKGNQAVNWSATGCWGHTAKSAVTANALDGTGLPGDLKFGRSHHNLWVNRVDKTAVFKTTFTNKQTGEPNQRYYLALSTATHHMFTSDG
jgi:hypothetical protein